MHVSREGLNAIKAAIWNELERSPSGDPVLLADGPYPGSIFYAARDTYYGLYTCNTWTAETLGTGGLGVPSTLVLFAGQVMSAVRSIGHQQSADAIPPALSSQLPPDDRRTAGK